MHLYFYTKHISLLTIALVSKSLKRRTIRTERQKKKSKTTKQNLNLKKPKNCRIP